MKILSEVNAYPGPEFVLHCPCGSEYTHFQALAAFMREEDEEAGRLTLVDQVETRVLEADPLMSNPSPRRDGQRLFFTRELCGGGFALVLYQHKGNTFVYTEMVP